MAGVLPYRKASGVSVAGREGEVGIPRWVVAVGAVLLVPLTAWVIAGDQARAVFETWGYGIFAIVLLVCAGICGMGLTAWFAQRGCFAGSAWPDGLRMVAAIALGLGVFALVILGLGFCGLLNPPWVVALVPVVGAIAGAWWAREFLRGADWSVMRRGAKGWEWLALAAAIPVGAMLVAATFPPGSLWRSEGRGYDVLEYHLEMPREYAAANSAAPVSHNVYSSMPANVEMLYLQLMQAARWVFDDAADGRSGDGYLWGVLPSQFLHAGLMVLMACAAALMPVRMSGAGRVVAGLLVLSVPWVIVTGSLAYNEGGMLLFGTLALGAALGMSDRSRTGNGILSGIFLGLAMGCKMTAGLFFAGPVGVILLLRGEGKAFVLSVVLAAAVWGPWAVRSAIYNGGNPVFPIATQALGRGTWTQEQAERFDKGHAAPESERSVGGRLAALGRESVLNSQWSPGWSIVLGGEEWWEKIGVLWLIVPPVLLLAMVRVRLARWLGLMVALQVVAWMFATQLESRFLLPVAIPLALLTGMAFEQAQVLRWLAGVVLLVQAGCAMVLLMPEAGLFGGVRKGWEQPPIGEVFSQQRGITAQMDNGGSDKLLLPHVKILFEGDSVPLFAQGEIVYNTVFDRNLLGDAFRRGGPKAAAEWLMQQRIRYVLIDWREIQRLRETYGFDEAITPQAVLGLQSFGVVPVGDTQSENVTLLRVTTP